MGWQLIDLVVDLPFSSPMPPIWHWRLVAKQKAVDVEFALPWDRHQRCHRVNTIIHVSLSINLYLFYIFTNLLILPLFFFSFPKIDFFFLCFFFNAISSAVVVSHFLGSFSVSVSFSIFSIFPTRRICVLALQPLFALPRVAMEAKLGSLSAAIAFSHRKLFSYPSRTFWW